MKKWKPWVLTLATLTVASAGISIVSTAIENDNIVQNINKPSTRRTQGKKKIPNDKKSKIFQAQNVTNDGFELKLDIYQLVDWHCSANGWITCWFNIYIDRLITYNKLHECFLDDNNSVYTYDSFWNMVIETLQSQGADTTGLTSDSFKYENKFTTFISSKNVKNSVQDILAKPENNNKTIKNGWTDNPDFDLYGSVIFKHEVKKGPSKYEAGNKDNILNNIEIKDNNLTSSDKLEDSKIEVSNLEENKKKLDEFEKQLGISSKINFNSVPTSFDSEIDKQKNEIKTLKSSASEIDTKISQANAKWQEELKTILGSNNTGLNLSSSATKFIEKWKKVMQDYDTKLKDGINAFKQEYEKVMSQKTNYRPHNWLWLVSGFEQNSAVLKDFEQQANALNNLYKERDTKLNELLSDQEVLNELKTLKDKHFKPIQNDIDEKNKKIKEVEEALVKNVENKLNDIKQENIRIRNKDRNENDNAIINATLQMKQGANLYQPIQPEDNWFDGTKFWYTQEPTSSIRKLYSRKDVVDAINDKVITLIKSKDTDFNLTPQDHPVVTEKSLTLLNADGQSHTIKEERGKLGSGDHQYEITVSTTYKIDPSTKKIQTLEFNVNAINQTIVKNNEAINDIVKRTQEIDKKVNEYQQKVEEVFNTETDGNNGVIKTYQDKQDALKTELDKTIQSSDLTNLVTYDLSKEFITKIDNEVKNVKNFGYYTKLNWWVLLIAILIIILVLLLLILLFIFINKNQQKYRYTV